MGICPVNKKILVVSHESSGTHFLIDSIALNSHLINQQIDLYIEHYLPPSEQELISYKNNLQSNIRSYFGKSTNRMFKSHHDVRFFDGILGELKKEFDILYIKRNPLDCLTSCYHYYSKHHHVDFPFSKNIDDFLFDVKPFDHLSDSAYSFKRSQNNVLRWLNHTYGWEKSGAHIVNYESLSSNFQEEIGSVFNKLKLDGPLYFQKPPLGGVAPRKGVVGDHKSLFSTDQVHRINKILKEGAVHGRAN